MVADILRIVLKILALTCFGLSLLLGLGSFPGKSIAQDRSESRSSLALPYDSDLSEEDLSYGGEFDPGRQETQSIPRYDNSMLPLSREEQANPTPSSIWPPLSSPDASFSWNENGSATAAPVPSSVLPQLPQEAMLPAPEQVALHFVRNGIEALSREDFHQAQESFEHAVEVAPQQAFGYYFLGRLAFAEGEHRKALGFVQKAELLFQNGDDSWRAEAARLNGVIYEDLRDYPHARAAYQRCLHLAPANLRAMSALARLASEEPQVDGYLPR